MSGVQYDLRDLFSGYQFADLRFSASGGDTVASFGGAPGDSLTFAGVAPALLGEEDFFFAGL